MIDIFFVALKVYSLDMERRGQIPRNGPSTPRTSSSLS